tara:strand:+ start:22 stop:1359 length:1338 start_codon:yes stop_codon:yes gene_type:complete
MANTYLSRTTGTPTTQNLWTWSAWVKFSNDNQAGATDGALLSEYQSASAWNKYERISNNRLRYNAGAAGHGSFVTSRNFSDLNAWYHIVIINDWQNSTTADRIRLYVNGVRETAFDSFSHPTSGGSRINEAGKNIRIGSHNNGLYFNGSMSHIHFTDGTAYDASYFGETDATTGEWKIKTSPSVTYGNNGYFILKDGNSVTDQSGKGNNWAVAGGTLTKTEDSPSNVFATLNPLIKARDGTPTFGSGNTTYKSTSTSWDSGLATIMPSSGKWYFEFKPTDNDNTMVGVIDSVRNNEYLNGTSYNGYLGYRGFGYQSSSDGSANVYNDGSATVISGGGWSANNICGVAIDLDNEEMFLHVNGNYTNSGNPTTRANPYSFSSEFIAGNPAAIGVSSRSNYITYVNFGNGYYLTTAVATAGTNASGNGIFEYDVPTGYTALSTKGLNL